MKLRGTKKVLAAATSLMLAFTTLTGCGSSMSKDAENGKNTASVTSNSVSNETKTSKGTDEFKLAVGLPDSGATMFSLMANNVSTMAKVMGGTANFQGGVGASADATISFVEEQIAAGANGIIISPPSDSVLTTVTTMCEDAGVYWGIAFRSISDEDVKQLVESSEYYVGHTYEDEESAGYQVMSKLHETGAKNVAIISMAKGNTTTDRREAGAQKACDEFGMQIVAEARDMSQASDATNAAESFLSSYPDLDAIFVVGTTGAGIHEAVAKAIEDAGKTDKVKLATIDFPDSMGDLFERGVLVTCAGAPSWGFDPYIISTCVVNSIKGNAISDKKLNLEIPMYEINDKETADKWLEKYGDANTLYFSEADIQSKLDKSSNKDLSEETLTKIIKDFTENATK